MVNVYPNELVVTNTPVLNELVVERNEPTERHFSEEDLNEVRR